MSRSPAFSIVTLRFFELIVFCTLGVAAVMAIVDGASRSVVLALGGASVAIMTIVEAMIAIICAIGSPTHDS